MTDRIYRIHNSVVSVYDLLAGSGDTAYDMYCVMMEEFQEYAMDKGYTNNDIEMTGRVEKHIPSVFLTVWLNRERKFEVTKPGEHIKTRMFSVKHHMNNSRPEREKLYDSILKWAFKK
jgi:hypothetical protein